LRPFCSKRAVLKKYIVAPMPVGRR